MKRSIGENISVCLLTYNHAETIESTLHSILDQTIAGYEVIVSDDCSTDGTWERVLKLAATDPRITPIRTSQNRGMPGNANFAVSQSRRSYIALLHHDDLYRRDLLEQWGMTIERYSDVAFVFNSYGLYGSDYVYAELLHGGRLDGRWLLNTYLFPRWGCLVRGTAMIRRDAWTEVGGMRERFGLLADVDLWMRLSMRWAVGYVPEPVVMVRHQRPDYYPDIYKSKSWSWRRQQYLYAIHAANRSEYWNLETLRGRFQWWVFRLRLSRETAKWLLYAILKRKTEMINTCGDSVTPYDQIWLRMFREAVRVISSSFGAKHASL